MARAEGRETFDDRNAAAILIIPAGMEASLKAGQPVALDFTLDPTNNNGFAVQQEVQQAIGQISRSLAVASASTREAEQIQPFASAAARQAYYDQSLEAAQQQFDSAPARVVITLPENTSDIEDQQAAQAAQASAGQLIIWVFIPLLGTSELLAYERVWGTLRRLVTTPTRKPTFLTGMITGQLGIWPGADDHAGGDRGGAAQGALGAKPAGAAGAAGQLWAGGGGNGHHAGHLYPHPQPGQWPEHRPGDGDGPAGRLHVADRDVPAGGGAGGENPADHLGDGGHDPAHQFTTPGCCEILPYAGVLLGFSVVFFVVGVWRFRYE